MNRRRIWQLVFGSGLLLLPAIASAQSYSLSTIAGSTGIQDNAPGTQNFSRSVSALAADSSGDVFVADFQDNRVRKVSPSGAVTTIAGDGIAKDSGDNGPASAAEIVHPLGLAVDSKGDVYIAEASNFVRRIDGVTGVITTVAGNGSSSFDPSSGDLAINSGMNPIAIAVDGPGNLYIADGHGFLLKVDAATGALMQIANSAGSQAGGPFALAVDPAGNVFTAAGSFIGMISAASGLSSIVAITTSLNHALRIAVDAQDDLYLSDPGNHVVRKLALSTGVLTTIAGTGTPGFSGDGGPAANAQFSSPGALAVSSQGALFIADQGNLRVRRVDPQGIVTTVLGGDQGDGGPAESSILNRPAGVAVGANGTVYIADSLDGRIRQITPDGTINTVAGSQLAPNSEVSAVAIDPTGDVYFVNPDSHQVLRTTAAGKQAVVAGNGSSAPSPDGGPATQAGLAGPTGIAFDSQGNLFIADESNGRVRRVSTTGLISTVAGNSNSSNQSDNILAINANVRPYSIAVDRDGNLYIGERFNHRVRKVDAATGVITTVAGNGIDGASGDGDLATSAEIGFPSGLAVDPFGNLLIADAETNTVRLVTPAGVISTVAGTGSPAYSAASGPATFVNLNPVGIATDSAGNVYVADAANDRIRKLTRIRGQAATASALAIVSGNSQSGPLGTALATPLSVRVVDSAGSPVAGVPVTFSAPGGAVTFVTPQVVTGSDGTASTLATLGHMSGPLTVIASAPGITGKTFQLTALGGINGNPPQIFLNGVVGAGLSSPVVASLSPGAIASIFGQYFAPDGTGKVLGSGDLVNGSVPTSLAGVCVLVGGLKAPVFAVFPTQINFQVPALSVRGDVSVQVITNCGTDSANFSAPQTVPMASASPEFFYFQQYFSTESPVAAVDSVTGALLGLQGLLPNAVTTPATRGEYITIFGTGFGPTSPAIAPGQLPSAAARVTAKVQIRVGSTYLDPADILYVGVTPNNAGLYQINIRLPESLSIGDNDIQISLNGIASPAGYLSIGQ